MIRQLDFEEEERPIVWREQFDSIHRDFESAFMEKESTYRMKMDECIWKVLDKRKRVVQR